MTSERRKSAIRMQWMVETTKMQSWHSCHIDGSEQLGVTVLKMQTKFELAASFDCTAPETAREATDADLDLA
jgi:hypothetical protein